MGFDCHAAANLEEARNLLGTYEFDICLTDMKLPDGNGIDFVKYIQSVCPDLPVAVITAHGNLEAAVEAMKNGAYDFVSKPVDINLLRKLVVGAVANNQHAANDDHRNLASKKSTQPTTASSDRDGTEALIGNSPEIQQLRDNILKVAKSNAPVWITGESGTGKELIARLIHSNGARASQPFIPINCGAIPSELVESELFGHLKGSFTGAISDSIGLIRQAEGGTLFLDEVAELPLQMQVKLLRAIQEKSVRAVGDKSEISVDVRILSASHKDLAQEVESGRFRHDLYYRLNVITLRSPPLSERAGDVSLLARHLLAKIGHSHGKESVSLTDAAIQKLEQHPFHGNVRELENILERAITMTDSSSLDADDLELSVQGAQRLNAIDTPTDSDEAPPHSEVSERQQILNALEATHWNRKAAAALLGLSYRQMRYRIQQFGLDNKE